VFINQRMERHSRRRGLRSDGEEPRRWSEHCRSSRRSRSADSLGRHFRRASRAHRHDALSRRCATHPGARAVESRRRSAGALAQTGQARARASEVDGPRAAGDLVRERDRRDSGHRARERDRVARRASRFMGSRARRDR
jgi:hypothetical protein